MKGTTPIAELLRRWRRISAEAMADADKIETGTPADIVTEEKLRLVVQQTVQTTMSRTMAACAVELERAWMSRPEVRRVQ